ncbi:hypothetical protein GCM10023115_08330 [Pontixanthobacter gangjinensis]
MALVGVSLSANDAVPCPEISYDGFTKYAINFVGTRQQHFLDHDAFFEIAYNEDVLLLDARSASALRQVTLTERSICMGMDTLTSGSWAAS